MIVAFSGAHSTGKTTSVQQVYELLPLTIRAKTNLAVNISRTCPFPLNKYATEKTQGWIMAKFMDILVSSTDDTLTLCDRTLIDWAAYSLYLKDVLQDFRYDQWLIAALEMFDNFPFQYDLVYVTEPETVIEADGIRDLDIKYQTKISESIVCSWILDMKQLGNKVIFPLKYKSWVGSWHECISQKDFVKHCVETIKELWKS